MRQLPIYPVIRSQIDVLTRPNGRYILLLWGAPVPDEVVNDGILFLDFRQSGFTLHFYHCEDDSNSRDKVIIAEADRYNSFWAFALFGQTVIDVVLVNEKAKLDTLSFDDFQKFQATCRKFF